MSELLDDKPELSFWMIGAFALVWNLIGLVFYYSHVSMTPDALEGFTEAQQAFFRSTPVWATSAYAVAVSAGVLASLFLLLRKAWAVPLFALSLIGIVVQDLHAFVVSNGLEVWGTEGIFLPALVLVVAIALLMYARGARQKRLLT
jgi:ABC-type Na+ efflux pump permease subunit